MSLNIKENGALRRIAGSTVILDATASEIREGTWINTEVDAATGDTRIEANVTFDVPMPDTDYMVVFDKPVTGHGESYNYVNVSTKSTTGFTFFVTYTGNLSHTPLGLQVHWYAIRLVELEGYTELQNKVNNPDSTPTENSTNLVTSGGVYDAIKNASSVFIGTSAEWESETSKTDYQVAILTDKPNVNAVDSTDGSTTVVGEPNKRWSGTTAEWEQFESDYPEKAAKIEVRLITDDEGSSGLENRVEALETVGYYRLPTSALNTDVVSTETNNIRIQTIGNLQICTGMLIFNTAGEKGNVTIFTLPTGYKPKYSAEGTALATGSSSVGCSSLRCWVEESGACKVWSNHEDTQGYLFLTVIYAKA